jgi:hypothetical protein
VHDVPSASKPTPNPTIARENAGPGHEKFYDYLRLRLPLEVGMVVVRLFSRYFFVRARKLSLISSWLRR